jgi:hypothetical protein
LPQHFHPPWVTFSWHWIVSMMEECHSALDNQYEPFVWKEKEK